MRKINVMLFDKAQEIVAKYQTENNLSNMEKVMNQILEEFDKCKKPKKEKKEEEKKEEKKEEEKKEEKKEEEKKEEKKEEEKKEEEVVFVDLDSQEKKE